MSRGGFVSAFPALSRGCGKAAGRTLGEDTGRHLCRPVGEGRRRFAAGSGAPHRFQNAAISRIVWLRFVISLSNQRLKRVCFRVFAFEFVATEVLREGLGTPLGDARGGFVCALLKSQILYFQLLGGFVYVISHPLAMLPNDGGAHSGAATS